MSARAAILFLAFVGLAQAGYAGEAVSDGSFESEERFFEKDGEAIFKNVCAACHMPDAKGAEGAARYPSLAGNPKLRVAAYPVFVVTNGQGAMPPFARRLTPEQIASVINYVRTHFGNAYSDAVTPAEVQAVSR